MTENAPYFMSNKEWYSYDKENKTYTLTDKAPKKAIESYNEFMKDWGKSYDWFAGMSDEEFLEFCKQEKARLDRETDNTVKSNDKQLQIEQEKK